MGFSSSHKSGHIPVLLKETIAALSPAKGDITLDLTVGRGGHSLAIGKIIDSTAASPCLYGIDLDNENLRFAQNLISQKGLQITTFHGSFVQWSQFLKLKNKTVKLIVADLGIASNQLDNPSRGFSFQANGPLDMRLNPSQKRTAANILEELTIEQLAHLIQEFGEEPLARRIAEKIGQTRLFEPILTTQHLSKIVEQAYGSRASKSKKHPATRTFMALRIAVNDELVALQVFLNDLFRQSTNESNLLHPEAKVAVITFHSLEDRLVKKGFKRLEQANLGSSSQKAILPSKDEILKNPRASSAKLRCFTFSKGNRSNESRK